MELLISLIIGICLSATSGFRVFVPLLILSIASLAGWVELSPAFSWLGSYPALVALLMATVLELAAYQFPFIDNLLSAIAVPISAVAGTLITASVLIDMHPMLAGVLALVAGGGAALGGSALSSTAHASSTVATGGTVNPVVSLLESVISFLMALLAVLVPILAFLLLLLLVSIMIRIIRKTKARPVY